MKPWLRRTIRVLLVALACLFLAPFLIFGALQIGPVRQALVSTALERVNEGLLGTVEIGRVNGSLLGHAQVEDLQIYDARGNLAADIEIIAVDFALMPLIRRQIQVDSVEIRDATALVRTYEDKAMNWNLLTEPVTYPQEATAPFDWPITVAAIDLRSADLVYLDESMALDENVDGLAAWRARRVADLNEATDGQRLRQDLGDAFDERPAPGPRAPAMLWLHDLETTGSLTMLGADISAEIGSLKTEAVTDILEGRQLISAGPLNASLSPRATRVELGELASEGWLDSDGLSLAMTTPAPFEPGTTITESMAQERPAFNKLVLDLAPTTIGANAFGWAAADLPIGAPITLRAQAAVTPDDLLSSLFIRPDNSDEELAVAASLSDYGGETPGYEFSVEAERFDLHQWLADADLPEVQTTFRAAGSGQGFDPETMQAALVVQIQDLLVDQTYEASTIWGEMRFADNVVDVVRLAALTPYLDLGASGQLDLDGEASLDLHTTADISGAAPMVDVDARAERAELAISLRTSFAPEFEDPLSALESADLSGQWDFRELFVGDLQIAQSQGDIDLSTTAETPEGAEIPIYDGTYSIDMTARSARFGPYSVGYLSVADEATYSLAVPPDKPLNILRRIDNDAALSLRGLQIPDGRLGQASLNLALTKRNPDDRRLRARARSQLSRVALAGISADQLNATVDADVDLRQSSSETSEQSMPDQPISRLQAALELQGDQLAFEGHQIGELTLDTTVEARLANRRDIWAMVRHFDWVADGRATTISLAAENGDGPQADVATVAARLSGPLDNPQGAFDASIEELVAADREFSTIELGATFHEERRRVDLDAQARGDGESYHSAFRVDYEPRMTAFTLQNLVLGTDRIEWRSTDDSALHWNGQRLEARDFDLRHENDEQSLYVDGHFQPQYDQSLQLSTTIDLPQLLHGFYLDEAFPDVEGSLDLEANIGGTSRAPTVAATVALADFHYDETGPVDIGFSADYRDEQLRVDELTAAVFDEDILDFSGLIPLAFNFEGRAEVFVDRYAELDVAIHPQQLRDFHEPLPVLNDYGVDGQVGLTFNWVGQLDDPDLALDLDIDGFQFQGEVGEEFFDLRQVDVATDLTYKPVSSGGAGLDFEIDTSWEDSRAFRIAAITPFPLEDWFIAIADGRGGAIAWRDEFLSLPFELVIDVPSLDLERIPLESLRESNLSGRAELDLALSGTVENPEGTVGIGLFEAGWRQFRDINFDFSGELRDQQALIEGIELAWGQTDLFSAEGIVPLPIPIWLAGKTVSDLPIDLRATIHEIPLSRLSAIDYQFARLKGRIGANLEATGSLRQPRFAIDAGLYETQLGDGSLGSLALEVQGEDNRLALTGGLSTDDQTLIDLQGLLPVNLDLIDLATNQQWQADGELQLDLESEALVLDEVLPTQLMTDVVEDPQGLLEFALNLRGTWAQPSVTGFLEMEDGALTLPEFARRFVDINGRVDIDDDTFKIENFELHDGPSSFSMAGSIGHELFVPGEVDVELSSEEFNLAGLGVDFPLFLTADMKAEGNLQGDPGELDLLISGLDVRMTDEWDRSLHSTSLDPDIVFVNEPGATTAAELAGTDPESDNLINLVLNVTVERDAWARPPMGDVNFQADLEVTLNGPVLSIAGPVDALRGELEFLGRRFAVQESTATFTGSVPPNPRLRLEAHHYLDRAITASLGPPSSGEPRVIIRISGNLDQPRLQLSSDPAMSETDILFVLMTGRPPDRGDIGRNEGVANQALAAVSGLFLGLLQDELAGRVPVDVLRLEPGAAGMRGGRLELGTYLTNDLFVAYRRQFGADENTPANIVRLEYHFLPRWMVELLYTDRNEGELNLFWDVF